MAQLTMGPWDVNKAWIEGWAHLEATVHMDRVGPMIGIQMRLDHGW